MESIEKILSNMPSKYRTTDRKYAFGAESLRTSFFNQKDYTSLSSNKDILRASKIVSKERAAGQMKALSMVDSIDKGMEFINSYMDVNLYANSDVEHFYIGFKRVADRDYVEVYSTMAK